MRMRLAWKKSQKTLDTSKRLHQNKTWSTGSAGKGLDPNFAIIGTADSGKCRSPPPPSSKEEVFKVFEPKRVDSLLLPWYNLVIMIPRSRQQGANCPLCPSFSFGESSLQSIFGGQPIRETAGPLFYCMVSSNCRIDVVVHIKVFLHLRVPTSLRPRSDVTKNNFSLASWSLFCC